MISGGGESIILSQPQSIPCFWPLTHTHPIFFLYIIKSDIAKSTYITAHIAREGLVKLARNLDPLQ